MKALLVLCLLASTASAQVAREVQALSPVDADFCKTCRKLARTPVAGLGTAIVYAEDHPAPDGGTTYWLAIVTKAETYAGGVFDVYPGNCGAGHCTYIDGVAPALRTFTYRADKARVTDVGLVLAVDRTDDLLETEPRITSRSKQWIFVVCGKDGDALTCRATESRCDRAGWARGSVPAVQTACTEYLAHGTSVEPL